MIFEEALIAGVWVVRSDPHADDRGTFARVFDAEAFQARGLVARFDVTAVSRNPQAGTLRGLHWQADPHGETKLIRCTRGRVWDVLVDVRPGSPTWLRHVAFPLDADGFTALYAPPGVAHGFLTLFPDSEVTYQVSGAYAPGSARGLRWDDPALAIPWPARPGVIGDRDSQFPTLNEVG